MTRICGKCKEKKPLTEFHARIVEGVNIAQTTCKGCISDWAKKRRKERMVERHRVVEGSGLALFKAWPFPAPSHRPRTPLSGEP